MADDDIKRMLAQAPFSFVGTVMHLGAATMADLSVDARTAVVHVDHVLHAPDAFARMEGQRITVQLASDADPPAPGQAFAFFAEGLAFGDSIAVKEVGRLPVESVESHATAALQAGAPASAFKGLVREMHQENLSRHMREADAVVVGRVVGVDKVGAPAYSEHDPDWWRATIEVFHVERGDVAVGQVGVLFANSLDVRWHRVPKPKAAQGGVWILHRTTGALQDLAPFQLLHPEDYQPTQELDVMRTPGP